MVEDRRRRIGCAVGCEGLRWREEEEGAEEEEGEEDDVARVSLADG